MTTHLIIPDAHDVPGQDKTRFSYIGKLAVELKPDVIVCLGDFADIGSLSSYDKGRRSHEGQRYKNDIDSANEALDTLEAPIREYNANAARNHKTRYSPRKVLTWGNHEERIDRATSNNAELHGHMSKDDIKFKEAGWETNEFLEVVAIDGVHYSHFFPSGIMGRPISGENPAASTLKKHYVSTVAGHAHVYDYAERTRADNVRIQGLVAGCYFDYEMDWTSKLVQHMWWSGLTILQDVDNGTYDLERISLKRLHTDYGS